MAGMNSGEMGLKRAKYLELLKDHDFVKKSREDQAQEVGVDRTTLWAWKKEITPAEWEKIRDDGRRVYAEHAPSIDAALIKKCLKGSEKAIELFYMRYEGWSPKQIQENINKGGASVSTEEVVETLLKAVPTERLAEEFGKRATGEKKVVGTDAPGS